MEFIVAHLSRREAELIKALRLMQHEKKELYLNMALNSATRITTAQKNNIVLLADKKLQSVYR